MKTRRSMQLQSKIEDKAEMQSILFPESRKRDKMTIVPETPGNSNSYESLLCTTSVPSVLETPDDEISKKSKLVDINKNKLFEQPCSSLMDISLNLNELKRKQSVLDILESEHSFANNLKNKFNSNSSQSDMEENFLITKTKKRNALDEIIFPFDLNNEKVLERKLSLKNKISSPKSVSDNNKRKSRSYVRRSNLCSPLVKLPSNSSPVLKNCTRISFGKHQYGERSGDKEATPTLSESDIVLTPANNGGIVLASVDPSFGLSESNKTRRNSNTYALPRHLPRHGNSFKIDSFEKICSLLQNYSRSKNLNGSILMDIHSPASKDVQSGIEGGLSPLNRELFKSDPLSLTGVIGFVDVRSGAENRSSIFEEILSSLGAEVKSKFTQDVTHVLFKDGSKATYERAVKRGVFLVSPLWLDACLRENTRVSESLFPISREYANQLQSPLVSGKAILTRKLRSMQPITFDADVRKAEVRLLKKKRRQSSAAVSELEDDVFSTPKRIPNLQNNEEAMNSPLFGIDHLVTPQRPLNGSSESSSLEKSPEEKEFNTSLAARMYKRICTPNQKFSENNGYENQPIRSMNLDETCNSECPNGNQANDSSGTGKMSLREATRTELESQSGICEGVSPKGDNNADSKDLSLGMLRRVEYLKLKDNSIEVQNSTEDAVTTNENELDIEDRHSNCVEGLNYRTHRRSRTKTAERAGQSRGKFKEKNSEDSQTDRVNHSSSLPRRRLLHTVDMSPTQDLIIPTTPPSTNSQMKSRFPYESLASRNVSQRERLNKLKYRNGNEVNHIPLPRIATLKNPQSCSSVSSNESSVLDAQSTPKSRFSLIKSTNNSLEEFRSDKKVRKRKFGHNKNESVPSICITSFHQSSLDGVYAIVKSLGGFVLVTDVDSTTTHVVCGADRRTLNVLKGISLGCWVLDSSWLYESVEMLQWAPEEPFELFNFCPGAKELLQNCDANVCSTLRSSDVIIGGSPSSDPESFRRISPRWVFDSIQHWEVKKFDQYYL